MQGGCGKRGYGDKELAYPQAHQLAENNCENPRDLYHLQLVQKGEHDGTNWQ